MSRRAEKADLGDKAEVLQRRQLKAPCASYGRSMLSRSLPAPTRRTLIAIAVGGAAVLAALVMVKLAYAAALVTPATGGTNISADSAADAPSPAWTTLGNIVITEGANADFAGAQTNKTLILTAPTGFRFNSGVGSATYTTGGNITAASISVTSSTATVTFSVSLTNKTDSMTISGLRAQPLSSYPRASGNILRASANPGTGTIAGITSSTNFGTLSESVGLLPANISLPVVSGTAAEGETLTASSGSWTNSPTSYAYQWQRCNSQGGSCGGIAGATSASYSLGSADLGATVRVIVTATNAAGSRQAASAVTSVVYQPAPTNTTLPQVSGQLVEGEILATTTGGWTNSPTAYAHQWRRCNSAGASCVDITGATSTAYVPTAADVGATLRSAVSAFNAAGSNTAASEATAIIAQHLPYNSVPPAISGSAQEEETLSASIGTWSYDPIAYGYQWLRCDNVGLNCSNISNAISSSYILAAADVDSTVRVSVTATNTSGSTSAQSAATPVVLTARPVNTDAPTIAGFGNESENLTASAGTWTNNPSSYSYSWQRCSLTGSDCSPITGATSSTYSASSSDVGHMVRVQVTAANTYGSTAVSSASLAILATAGQLAIQFRPYIRFDTAERWRPLNIHDFLSETFTSWSVVEGQYVTTPHQACKLPESSSLPDCLPLQPQSPESSLTSAFAGDCSTTATCYLEIHDGMNDLNYRGDNTEAASIFDGQCSPSSSVLLECDNGTTAIPNTIYYRYSVNVATDRRYIDYWWFLRYNNVPWDAQASGPVNSAASYQIGNHAGDWEGVTVEIDPFGGGTSQDEPTVRRVYFSQHRKGVLRWVQSAAVSLVAGRPVVYAANGTHASYPDPCEGQVCDIPFLPGPVGYFVPEGSRDGEASWSGNAGCNDCVLPFPTEQTSWTYWPGYKSAGSDPDVGYWGQNVEPVPVQVVPGIFFDSELSPTAPGNQLRFRCASAGWQSTANWDCSGLTDPSGEVTPYSLRFTNGQSSAAAMRSTPFSSCASSFDPEVAVLGCSARQLTYANTHPGNDSKGTFRVRLIGTRSSRRAPALGVVQILRHPLLRTGDRIVISGRRPRDFVLMLQVMRGRGHSWTAVFRGTRFVGTRTTVVKVFAGSRRPRFSVGGRSLRPYSLRGR